MRTSHPDLNRCEWAEQVCAHALQILPEGEVAAAEAHIASCPDCQRELGSLRAVVNGTVRNLVCGAIVTPMEGDYGDQEGHIG
jgi:hypothetical protein